MKRLLLVVSAVIALSATLAGAQALPSAKPEQVGLSPERLGRIGRVLGTEIEKGSFPGAVVLVARKGRIAYFESFGMRDKASGAPMTKDTIFRIYSMTKPLTSVGTMMLMEEGKIVLTDPVSKYLPPFAKQQVSVPKFDPVSGRTSFVTVPADREMTVQDLLRHTSGLAYAEITMNTPVKEAYTKALYLPDSLPFDTRGITSAEEVGRLGKAPLAHQPGTVWEYSMSTDILGRVIEAASGTSLGQFLEDRLFVPLKMSDSGFSLPKDKLGRLAQPLPADAAGLPIKLFDVSAPPKNDSGGAGGVSTAADYTRFSQMLLNGGQLDDVRVLSRSTVRLMTSDHLGAITGSITPGELLLGTRGYTFGLGFAVRQGDGVAGTPGAAGEFMWAGYAGTYFWVDPKEELVVVFMTQAPSPMRAQYRKLIKQLVYQAIVE